MQRLIRSESTAFQVQFGDMLPVYKVSASGCTLSHSSADNLISSAGMSDYASRDSRHDNDAAGHTMWLAPGNDEASGEPAWVLFDFGGTYPIHEMWVWNYNQQHPAYPGLCKRGMKDIRIEYSLDNRHWTELKGSGYPYRLACADGSSCCAATNLDDGAASPVTFNNVIARYVKLTAREGIAIGNWGGYDGQEALYGLSAVRFYAGQGYTAERDTAWTQLFLQQSGWSGSDGIYFVPFDGIENRDNDHSFHSLILFGDTFIGEVDGATNNRITTTMVNNTLAVLEGSVPERDAISFKWRIDEDGKPLSAFLPDTTLSKSIEDSYYWLQDGISIGGKLYCFPMIIGPNPNGAEGFQFALHGVTRLSAPLDSKQGVLWHQQKQIDTPLYYTANNGYTTYFGAAIMPNTEEAGAPEADGYIYIYGLQNQLRQKPVAARVAAEHFEDFNYWSYWNGSSWTSVKEEAVPFADEVSSEYSISPNPGGNWNGKYIMVYQLGGIKGNLVRIAAGNSPVGPFDEPISVFYCPEPDSGDDIYTYNTKAHPHLSRSGELLVSYNVNTTSWDAHLRDATIYRPRFLTLRCL